ncbi:Putative lipase atg15 [Nosema bombycis CQ1]|uniref:triacylglycerol lipase n=1 Tax=Nosema bombycis (strain CQ1 / CVCC 102059) TaxID=578461 RepID=R0MHJ8_NOSB1|nr:Putative lipase atg15 [Nosema bombycis CQ1]|eukprot:EOB13625.1 Putative lipase atg15 [Nosema bombycis CQ1]
MKIYLVILCLLRVCYNLSIQNLLRMSIEAYKEDSNSNYDLIYSFGHNKDGLRAKVFKIKRTIVIAVKGTTLYFHGISQGPTGHKDREMDNLMFGICPEENEACLYKKKLKIDKAKYLRNLEILVRTVSGVFRDYEILLTGHSLGGALSSLMSLRLSFSAIAFSSPGEKYVASVLGFNQKNQLKITHFGICEDSLYLGGCKSLCNLMGYTIDTSCHLGRSLCVGLGDGRNFRDSFRYHRAKTLLDILLKRTGHFYEIYCDRDII